MTEGTVLSGTPKLILASASPRRSDLLRQAGIRFEARAVDAPEDYPPDLDFGEVALHIARNKAGAAESQWGGDGTVILAADTIVVLDGAIIGKPVDDAGAKAILRRLSGRTHLVLTGVDIRSGARQIRFTETTEVQFDTLSAQDIDYYVHMYQPFDKAGAYAIQEWIGLRAVRGIRGDYYNVMGLPVSRTIRELRAFGDF